MAAIYVAELSMHGVLGLCPHRRGLQKTIPFCLVLGPLLFIRSNDRFPKSGGCELDPWRDREFHVSLHGCGMYGDSNLANPFQYSLVRSAVTFGAVPYPFVRAAPKSCHPPSIPGGLLCSGLRADGNISGTGVVETSMDPGKRSWFNSLTWQM